jgi:formylglycine-generating enzyme required for sulfatase activity
MRVCGKCGRGMAASERFCGECGGAPVEREESAEAVAAYEAILGEFASDGVLEGWELDELGRQREELGISQATHERLVARHQPVTEKLPLVLEVDEGTLAGFQAGSQGVIRARLRNTGERPVKNVTIRHAVSGEPTMREHVIRMMGPGRDEEIALVVLLSRGGQYALETVVRAEDMRGKGQSYRSAPLAFAVGREAGGGPQSVSVSVDASSMRVAGDPLVNLAGVVGGGSRGGSLAGRSWTELGLRLMTPEEWERWAQERDAGTRERKAAAEAQARAAAEAEARAKREAEERAKAAEAERKATAEAQAKAKREAEERAKRAAAEAEAARRAKAEAEAKAAAEPAWRAAWMSGCGTDAHGAWAETRVGSAVVKLRWCPPGRFLMGSPAGEEGRFGLEGPQHEVELTRGFWLGETPVTQAQWEAVMGTNPSHFRGANRPVEQVSWDDCQGFLARANGLVPGLNVRLATEAEWEHACRAGSTGARYGALDEVAWYYVNAGDQTQPVKGKAANAWGLYDTLGNVWEWCADLIEAYATGRVVDPTGPSTGSLRVYRGGSWSNVAQSARAACRSGFVPSYRGDCLGFRLARGQ